MQELRQIPLADLRPGPDKSWPAEVDANFLATVRAHGLIHPLAVRRDGGTYVVIAGYHRVAAVLKLSAAERAARFGEQCLIPCHVLDPQVADAELTIVENTMRREMPPMDEYEAFAQALRAPGATIEAIAGRFGYPAKTVRQRLALASLIPAVKDLVRAGKIDIEAAEHLTTATPAEQQQLLPALKRGHVNGWQVASMLKERGGALDAGLPGVRGLYEKAGGKIIEDLFSRGRREDDAGGGARVADPALFNRLNLAEADRLIAKAKEKYAHAALIKILPNDYGWRDKIGHPRGEIKDHKRLCYFVVLREGRYEVHNDTYLKQHDPLKGKPERAKSSSGKKKGAPLGHAPLTQAATLMLNRHRAAVLRVVLSLAAPRKSVELCLTALLGYTGGTISLSGRLNEGASPAEEIGDVKSMLASNRAAIDADAAFNQDLALRLRGKDEHDEVGIYRRLAALSEAELMRTFAGVFAMLVNEPDRAQPMDGDSLFAALAADMNLHSSGYFLDRFFLEGVRDRARLNALAKQAGVEPAKTRAETIARILKAKPNGMAIDESRFARPPAPKAKKKKAA